MRLTLAEGDRTHEVALERAPDGSFRVTVDGVALELRAGRTGEALDLEAQEGVIRVWLTADGDRRWVSAPGLGETVLERQSGPRRRRPDGDGGGLSTPMPGRVVQVLVAPGDRVERGQPLVVVEAMKTELTLAAPRAGVVRRVHARVGAMTEAQVALVELEGEGEGEGEG